MGNNVLFYNYYYNCRAYTTHNAISILSRFQASVALTKKGHPIQNKHTYTLPIRTIAAEDITTPQGSTKFSSGRTFFTKKRVHNELMLSLKGKPKKQENLLITIHNYTCSNFLTWSTYTNTVHNAYSGYNTLQARLHHNHWVVEIEGTYWYF